MGGQRIPAAFCSAYGFRPTWGLVPDDAKVELFLHRLARGGPMARAPADLALLLSALAGPEPKMPVQLPVPDLTLDPKALQGACIGWLADWGGALPFEEGILATLDRALRQMGDLGATVDHAAPPLDRDAIRDSWTTLRSWAIAARFDDGWSDPDLRAALKPEMICEIERGRALPGLEIDRASRTRLVLWLALA